MKCEDVVLSSQDLELSRQKDQQEQKWTTVIGPKHPWYRFDLQELWLYRDLVKLFVRRDFVAQYKQTILGPLWFLLQPLFSTLVFTVVFGRIANIPTDGVPDFLFFLAGTVCWAYFSGCMTQNSETFISNAAIFGKVYFPRVVMPIAVTISHIIKFFIQFLLFAGIFLLYGGAYFSSRIIIGLLILPLLILQMGLLGIGVGILVSSVTTKYRDLRLVVNFGAQLWMYATPVVYPLSQVPERFRIFFVLNPMSAVLECFRWGFFGTKLPDPEFIFLSLFTTAALLFLGMVLFNRVEKTFMDTV